MKTSLLYAFLFCLSFPLICFAQSNTAQQKANLFLGATLGFNTGKLKLGEFSYYNQADFSNYNNLGGGVLLHLKIKNNFFIQTELTYSKKTAVDEAINVFPFSEEDIYSTVEFTISYLNYPILGGYSFSKGSLKPYFATGLLIGSTLKKEVTDIPNTDLPPWKNPATSPITTFESIQYGWVLETGIQKNLNGNSILIGSIRYTVSEAAYTTQTNSGFGAGAGNLPSQRFSVSGGILLAINKK